MRAYDRIHAIELMKPDVDYQIRETFESALAFGRATLEELGRRAGRGERASSRTCASATSRAWCMQKAEGIMGGADLAARHASRAASR